MASSASPSSSKSDDVRRTDGGPRDPAATAAAAQTHAAWAASMQAYYAAAGHPYAWPPLPQHLMMAAAYGAPVPFPLYHPAYYAHASMVTGVPRSHMAGGAAAAVAEGNNKSKNSGGPSGEDSSGRGDGESEESSEKRVADADADQKDLTSPKRRRLGHADAAGEPSQAAMTEQNAVAQNLNIGMDIWCTSPMAAVPSGRAEVNAGASLQRDNALPQMQDEREFKRERRKQSNRESARRSRLRKQQECEELSQKVTDLTVINTALRSELDKLKKDCEDVEAENSQLMDEMVQSEGSSVITILSIKVDTSKAHHGSSGQLNERTNDDNKV
ncbi:hypothetical protein ABZP36_018194 [Zizania latifolia]